MLLEMLKNASFGYDVGVRNFLASLVVVSQIMSQTTVGSLCVPWKAGLLKIIFLHTFWLKYLTSECAA